MARRVPLYWNKSSNVTTHLFGLPHQALKKDEAVVGVVVARVHAGKIEVLVYSTWFLPSSFCFALDCNH